MHVLHLSNLKVIEVTVIEGIVIYEFVINLTNSFELKRQQRTDLEMGKCG